MSERDELIAYLRVCSACHGCGIGADGDTCTNCDDRRQPNRRAADLLERDGAEIARLRVEREREERECGEVMDERDRYSDALAESHIALGGDGEWAARTWNPSPPDSGDLARDVPALAAAVKRELDEARAALAEAQRDTDHVNWLEYRAYRVDVRVKKSGNRLWVVNPPACMEYELSRSLREALDIAIAKEQSHASE